MVEKHFINAQQLLEDSFRLGVQILKSGFKPNFIVGIWRGGTPVGIAVQELLDYFKVHTDHISIRTSSYEQIEQRSTEIRVHGLDYIVDTINSEDNLLIVDDVYDTGLSVQAVVETLENRCRKNTPADLRIATAYYKPVKNKTERVPDYYVHETDKWLIFPHELKGLSREQVLEHKPEVKDIIEDIL